MANCGRITANILTSCDDLLVGGSKNRLILINQDDLVDYDYNVSNPQIIEAINLLTSPNSNAFVVEGLKNSVEETRSAVISQYQSLWNHQIVFRVFTNTPEAKIQLEALKNGKFIAVLENNYRGSNGNAAFELYGKVQGLELTVAEAVKNDATTQGAYVITLSTGELKEPNLPATIFLTDYETTKALVDSLLI